MTDQAVDWGVCWQLREGRQELMRFNWFVSCRLSLVAHLTLSDGVSLLHLQGTSVRGRKRPTLDIYVSVHEAVMYVDQWEIERVFGRCYWIKVLSWLSVVVIPLWSIGRNPPDCRTFFLFIQCRPILKLPSHLVWPVWCTCVWKPEHCVSWSVITHVTSMYTLRLVEMKLWNVSSINKVRTKFKVVKYFPLQENNEGDTVHFTW